MICGLARCAQSALFRSGAVGPASRSAGVAEYRGLVGCSMASRAERALVTADGVGELPLVTRLAVLQAADVRKVALFARYL